MAALTIIFLIVALMECSNAQWSQNHTYSGTTKKHTTTTTKPEFHTMPIKKHNSTKEPRNRRHNQNMTTQPAGNDFGLSFGPGTVRADNTTVPIRLLSAPGQLTYTLVKILTPWDDARKFCKSYGLRGDLASFTSYSVLKQIQKQFTPGQIIWVGGYCNKSDPQRCENSQKTIGWRWLTGEPIPVKANGYTGWTGYDGQPNSYNATFNRLSIYALEKDSGLAAYPENSPLFFICSNKEYNKQ